MNPLIIYVRGGDRAAPEIAKRGGMLYGVRHDYKPYAPVFMLDIHWENYSWPDYLAKVRAYAPKMAMVADYEYPRQKRLMLAQVADIKRLGVDHVMVCPKFDGAVDDIPSDCVLGVSVPTTYAGFLPRAWEIQGRRLHLLGGHPDQQNYLMWHRYAGIEVFSVDGNELGYKARHGQFWGLRRGTWETAPKNKYSSDFLAVMSAKSLPFYFSRPARVYRADRVTKCMYISRLVA